MNEQIKELYEQSQIGPGLGYDIDKFAELIIQECASICYNSNLQDSDLHAQNLLYEFNIDNARNLK